jgi:hypothetical protein
MDMQASDCPVTGTTPLFDADAERLAADMSEFNAEQIGKLLKVSEKLALQTVEQYQHFDSKSTPRKAALLAYNGSVFKAIGAKMYDKETFEYAQNRIRIISILYGLLRPLDQIKAYRAEYKLRLSGMNGNLYDYWMPRLTPPLLQDASLVGNIIINLASLDVMEALNKGLIEQHATLITPEFKELRNGKYEQVRTYAKMARGEMTHYIIENRIENPEDLKAFTWAGFAFNEAISNDTTYFFTREKP